MSGYRVLLKNMSHFSRSFRSQLYASFEIKLSRGVRVILIAQENARGASRIFFWVDENEFESQNSRFSSQCHVTAEMKFSLRLVCMKFKFSAGYFLLIRIATDGGWGARCLPQKPLEFFKILVTRGFSRICSKCSTLAQLLYTIHN